jgi:hypothetical protein
MYILNNNNHTSNLCRRREKSIIRLKSRPLISFFDASSAVSFLVSYYGFQNFQVEFSSDDLMIS